MGLSSGSHDVSTLNLTEFMMYNVPLAEIECWNVYDQETYTCGDDAWICYVRLNKCSLNFALIFIISLCILSHERIMVTMMDMVA